jgi:hypothetical protein
MIFAVLAMASSAHAGITKWVDADGKVHYSDGPPPASAKSQKPLNIQSSPAGAQPASAGGEGKSLAERDLESRKRRVEAEEAAAKEAKDKEEAKRKQANCAQARAQLQALQEGQRMSSYNEKGERVFMEDSARPAAIEEAKRAVDSWCK